MGTDNPTELQIEQRKRSKAKWHMNGAICQLTNVKESGLLSEEDTADITHAINIITHVDAHFSTRPTGVRGKE